MRSAIEVLKSRRSHRTFLTDEVPDKVLSDILDCGRLAPTANNRQPWLLGAVVDPILRGRIATLADHGKFIATSPVCFAVFVRSDEKYFMEDGCAATMNIIMASEAHGLGTCWVAGHKKGYAEEVRRVLGVPEGFTLISLVACGRTADEPRPKKKPLGELTFWDRYQEPVGDQGRTT